MLSLAVLALCLPQDQAPAQDLSPAARVRAFLEARREAQGFPGVSVAWSGADGKVQSVVVGLADVEEKRPMKPADRLLSGSVGKTYVAALTLLQVAEKTVDLDAKISGQLGDEPWFDGLPNAANLTLRALLRHRSGIPEYVYNRKFLRTLQADPDKVWKRGEQLALVAGAKPLFAVERGWSYADTNYLVVGEYLRVRNGADIEAQLQKRILDRFELRDTVFSNRRAVPGLVPGYTQLGRAFGTPVKTVAKGRYAINPQFEGCGGGFASTAADLCRWGRIFGRAEFLPEVLRLQRDDTVPASRLGHATGYGLGMIRRRTRHGVARGHSGFMPGYRAEMYYFAKHDLSVALLMNTDRKEHLERTPEQLLDGVAARLVGAKGR